MSQNAFAKSIGVSAMRISHVINGSRSITAEVAVLFGRTFGQTPAYWINLQTCYDLKNAEKALAARVKEIRPLVKAS